MMRWWADELDRMSSRSRHKDERLTKETYKAELLALKSHAVTLRCSLQRMTEVDAPPPIAGVRRLSSQDVHLL